MSVQACDCESQGLWQPCCPPKTAVRERNDKHSARWEPQPEITRTGRTQCIFLFAFAINPTLNWPRPPIEFMPALCSHNVCIQAGHYHRPDITCNLTTECQERYPPVLNQLSCYKAPHLVQQGEAKIVMPHNLAESSNSHTLGTIIYIG
jgi:hypothetical protein